MPTIINHPASFKEGIRAFMLKGRHKDGIVKERTILRLSYDAESFDKVFNDLVEIMLPNERIYVNAGARDIQRAIRLFKERQLDADYDDDPTKFYRHIETRWHSCLMDPSAQAEKFWLFDCDNDADMDRILDEYIRIRLTAESEANKSGSHYVYASKNGWHIVTRPFNKSLLSHFAQEILHPNAIMLWAY